ncbi:MAG TPA: DUF3887 domain-containing protein [Rhodanobacteraceae bacterium]|nr:DUF3887 domain-containing protein [Rhodanobacteraceae bacterium]
MTRTRTTRTRITLALLAIALPAFAAAQPPAATARIHPASSAHANAVAGQADATRIEACDEAAHALLDHLAKSEYKAATGNFNAQMAAALNAEKLGEVWQSIATRYGKVESRGTTQNMLYAGLVVVTVPLRFASGTLGVRLACDADGKFSGFHLVPVPYAAPAASN